MGYFNETIAAALDGRRVQAAYLVEFQFVSATWRVWNGNGDLPTDGKTFKGLRGLGQIDGLEQAVNGNAPQATFSLSGVSTQVQAEEQGDPADYVNQPVIVYLQFFNEDWSLLDTPYAIWGGRMQTFQESYGWDESQKAYISTVGITAESWFVGRGRPPYGSYSDQDQQLRFPGDKGCDFMAPMQNYTIRWGPHP